jgi:hypothetical protein
MKTHPALISFLFVAQFVPNSVGAQPAVTRFVGSYICSVEKAYDIVATNSEPTEEGLPKAALSFAIDISTLSLKERQFDCSIMAQFLKDQMASNAGVANWQSVSFGCISILNLKQRLNNGFAPIERDYNLLLASNDEAKKDGLDFEEEWGRRFHLSPTFRFTITSPLVDGGIEFERGTCAPVGSK